MRLIGVALLALLLIASSAKLVFSDDFEFLDF